VAVDIRTEIEIDRPRTEVARYAADPNNATEWYENVERVEWKPARQKKRPLGVGSRVEFVGALLGRRLSYTYEVREFVPLERLVMRTADGPFAVETTYTWEDTAEGATRMTLRNRGEPSGFSSRMAAPLMASAMRRANRNDLARLKQILEAESD
jgi:uncharacterized protein YndB with AHSA1/START domain